MYANRLEFEFFGTMFKFRKRNKISLLTFYVLHKGDVRYTTNMLRCYFTADYFSARSAEPGPGLKRSVPALIDSRYSTTTTTFFTIYVTDDYTSQ